MKKSKPKEQMKNNYHFNLKHYAELFGLSYDSTKKYSAARKFDATNLQSVVDFYLQLKSKK